MAWPLILLLKCGRASPGSHIRQANAQTLKLHPQLNSTLRLIFILSVCLYVHVSMYAQRHVHTVNMKAKGNLWIPWARAAGHRELPSVDSGALTGSSTRTLTPLNTDPSLHPKFKMLVIIWGHSDHLSQVILIVVICPFSKTN